MDAVPTANRIETLLAESEWVGALALGLVRDEVAADDLVQDTWLAALRRPPAARDSLRPWLATVTRNAARFQRRSEGARKDRESSRAQGALGEASPAPEELLARLETQELVSRLVRELPADLSEVILLSFFEGLSSDEIARQRDIPAGTVRWRKKRALEVLRERLDARYDGDRSAWLSALTPLAANASQKSAPVVGIGGILAGLLAPWFAMSVPTKVVAVLALALLAATPLIELGGEAAGPSTHGAATPEFEPVAPLLNSEENPELTRVPMVATNADATVQGEVVEEEAPPVTSLRLRVIDEFGAPVSDVEVTASPSLDMERQHEELFAGFDALKLLTLQAQLKQRTGADGVAEWSTDLVRFGGVIDFYAEGPRFASGELRAAIEPGVAHDLGELTLKAGGAVRGVARTESGGSPGKLLLYLGPVELPSDLEALERFGPDETTDSTTSRASGTFAFDGVTPGEYRVYVSPAGVDTCTWSEPFEVVAGQATEHVELIAAQAGELAELLVLGADGQPLTTAWVRVESGETSISGMVDDEGLRRWGKSFGSWAGGRAFISDRSLLHRKTEVELPMESRRVVVRMERAATLERRLDILDPNGTALADVRLQIAASNGTRDWPEFQSGDTFMLPASSEGTFDLSIHARGFAPYLEAGLTESMLPGDWSITLSPLPGLRGIVTANGEPVADAAVEVRWKIRDGKVFSKGNNVSRLVNATGDETTTDARGSFHLHQEEDGNIVVLVSATGFADAFIELDGFSAAGGESDLHVELDTGGVLRGTVLDHGGAPVPGAAVVLDHPFHTMRRKHAERDGTFRFTGVPAGDWYLRTVDEFDSGWLGWTVDVPEGWSYPTNVRIDSGSERVHDLWLDDPEGSSISGYVVASGIELNGLTAHLAGAGAGTFGNDPFAQSWDAQSAVEDGGSFGFLVAPGRDYTLAFSAPGLGGRIHRQVSADELPLHIDEQLEFATISANFTNWEAEGGGHTLFVRWESEGWTFNKRLEPGADGWISATPVPAGPIEITWMTRGYGNPQTMALELAPGEERKLELK